MLWPLSRTWESSEFGRFALLLEMGIAKGLLGTRVWRDRVSVNEGRCVHSIWK